MLDDMQRALYERALKFRMENTFRAANWAELAARIEGPGGFVEAGWCGDAACEAKVKEETKATIRLLPLEKKSMDGVACAVCGKQASDIAVFARAY
jgi:prolyl-tRNA synthetase